MGTFFRVGGDRDGANEEVHDFVAHLNLIFSRICGLQIYPAGVYGFEVTDTMRGMCDFI